MNHFSKSNTNHGANKFWYLFDLTHLSYIGKYKNSTAILCYDKVYKWLSLMFIFHGVGVGYISSGQYVVTRKKKYSVCLRLTILWGMGSIPLPHLFYNTLYIYADGCVCVCLIATQGNLLI